MEVDTAFPDLLVKVSGLPWIDVSISKLGCKRLVHLVNTSGEHKGAGIINLIKPVGPIQLSIRSDRNEVSIY